jgi:hypothetical protein
LRQVRRRIGAKGVNFMRLSFSEVLQLIEVTAIVCAAFFAGYQLRELRLQNSADLSLRLSQELDSRENERLEDALDSDPATPILRGHGGRFTVDQIDGYLGEYETLDDLYKSGLITCRMMYNEFSYDIETAYKNRDVMAQVATEQKEENDPTVWEGFLDLGRQFDNGYHCQ